MQFTYIFNDQTHTDISLEYMTSLGMSQAQMDEVMELRLAHNTRITHLRKQAYQRESDSLFMEWQFDQTPETEQRWRDKVNQIKTRYPLLPDLNE